MGACSIEVRARGKSMQDAFKRAQEEATEEYGYQQGYSGHINCCELDGDVTHKRGSFAEEDYFHQWILNNTSKRDVKGYCITEPVVNTNKIKTVVTNFPQKGTRKWETVYVAFSNRDGCAIHTDISQTNCIKKAREYVEKNPNVSIHIEIRKRLVGSQTRVATIDYKKATNEKDGLYCFVGWAPE
jgi:hypothetical protein